MKKVQLSSIPTLENIISCLQTAMQRADHILLSDRQQQKKKRSTDDIIIQQLRGILVAELKTINMYPDDVYELLTQKAIENEENFDYVEELTFLEHCIR